jgi:hypothetical protein
MLMGIRNYSFKPIMVTPKNRNRNMPATCDLLPKFVGKGKQNRAGVLAKNKLAAI